MKRDSYVIERIVDGKWLAVETVVGEERTVSARAREICREKTAAVRWRRVSDGMVKGALMTIDPAPSDSAMRHIPNLGHHTLTWGGAGFTPPPAIANRLRAMVDRGEGATLTADDIALIREAIDELEDDSPYDEDPGDY